MEKLERMSEECIAMCLDGTVIRTMRDVRPSCHIRPERPKRKLANILCPFCGDGDVWIVGSYQSKYRWYCQSCGKKISVKAPDDEVPFFDTCNDIITNLIRTKAGAPITVYDLKKTVNLEPEREDVKIVFDNATDSFMYLIALLGCAITFDEEDGE